MVKPYRGCATRSIVYTPGMDQLVLYSQEIQPDAIEDALSNVTVLTPATRIGLVEALVENPRLIGAVIEIPESGSQPGDDPDADWQRFLASVRRSFRLLPILVLGLEEGTIDGVSAARRPTTEEAAVARIAAFCAGPHNTDRREHHRFDWPLRARIPGSDAVHRIREIGAGGAYLEPYAEISGPGSTIDITVEFQNFTLTTTCEILDPRHVQHSDRPGFGVRFVSLSEQGAAFIDRIVGDALARVLLDPDAEPEVPSIDEEEYVLTAGDEFSLSI